MNTDLERTLILTRDAEGNQESKAQFLSEYKQIVSLDLVSFSLVEDLKLAEKIVRTDYIVFTSRRGVECFAGQVEKLADEIKIAVVGKVTADSFEKIFNCITSFCKISYSRLEFDCNTKDSFFTNRR